MQRGLSAIAEHLVYLSSCLRFFRRRTLNKNVRHEMCCIVGHFSALHISSTLAYACLFVCPCCSLVSVYRVQSTEQPPHRRMLDAMPARFAASHLGDTISPFLPHLYPPLILLLLYPPFSPSLYPSLSDPSLPSLPTLSPDPRPLHILVLPLFRRCVLCRGYCL